MDDESVMAASERLMELLDQRDQQETQREREDRLWEIADFRLVKPETEEPKDA